MAKSGPHKDGVYVSYGTGPSGGADPLNPHKTYGADTCGECIPSDEIPLPDAWPGLPGTHTEFARWDHVHPLVDDSNTWFVAKSGSNVTGNGSEHNPYLTVQHAVDEAVTGDVIDVGPGLYEESVYCSKTLSIRGHICQDSATIIQGPMVDLVPMPGIGVTDATQATWDAFLALGPAGYDGGYGALDEDPTLAPFLTLADITIRTATDGIPILVVGAEAQLGATVQLQRVFSTGIGMAGLYSNYGAVKMDYCDWSTSTSSQVIARHGFFLLEFSTVGTIEASDTILSMQHSTTLLQTLTGASLLGSALGIIAGLNLAGTTAATLRSCHVGTGNIFLDVNATIACTNTYCEGDVTLTDVGAVAATWNGGGWQGTLLDAGMRMAFTIEHPKPSDLVPLVEGIGDPGTAEELSRADHVHPALGNDFAILNMIYVAKNGDDGTGDGSEHAPYLTVQHAVDEATDGQVINVAPGEYVESVRCYKRVTIRGHGGQDSETIIRGTPAGYPGIGITDANAVTWAAFCLVGHAAWDGAYSALVHEALADPRTTLVDLRVETTGDGIPIAAVWVDHATIEADPDAGVRLQRVMSTTGIPAALYINNARTFMAYCDWGHNSHDDQGVGTAGNILVRGADTQNEPPDPTSGDLYLDFCKITGIGETPSVDQDHGADIFANHCDLGDVAIVEGGLMATTCHFQDLTLTAGGHTITSCTIDGDLFVGELSGPDFRNTFANNIELENAGATGCQWVGGGWRGTLTDLATRMAFTVE
jgi:hypothetical protein